MSSWQIDGEGRIFFEGRYVAKIERREDSDGMGTPPSMAFCAMRVSVEDPAADRLSNRVFESRVMGTSGDDELTKDEWEAINAGDEALVPDPEDLSDPILLADAGAAWRASGRELVLNRILTEPGSREQAIEGLTALAELDTGDCSHVMKRVRPEDCVRCQARRLLKTLDEDVPVQAREVGHQTITTGPGFVVIDNLRP